MKSITFSMDDDEYDSLKVAKGFLSWKECFLFLARLKAVACQACRGTGLIQGTPCFYCEGRGFHERIVGKGMEQAHTGEEGATPDPETESAGK